MTQDNSAPVARCPPPPRLFSFNGHKEDKNKRDWITYSCSYDSVKRREWLSHESFTFSHTAFIKIMIMALFSLPKRLARLSFECCLSSSMRFCLSFSHNSALICCLNGA